MVMASGVAGGGSYLRWNADGPNLRKWAEEEGQGGQ